MSPCALAVVLFAVAGGAAPAGGVLILILVMLSFVKDLRQEIRLDEAL
jgi:hypothetical protein